MTTERSSLNHCVFLVTFSDWDTHYVVSAWTTEDAATAESKRLAEEHKRSEGSYDVEGFPLDKVPA